jgi:hypothetical protein
MQKEQLLENELARSTTEEPHFDEDWTVLSAQPVVPLEELQSNNRTRRVLKLFAAFVGASLLGVFVALASIRLRETTAEVSEEAAIPAKNEPSENANDQPVENSTPANETALMPAVVAAPVSPKTEAKVTVSAKHQSIQSAPQTSSIETEAPDDIKPRSRLIEEWQERRLRRSTIRRQRREFDDLHHRDLLRIDEIFEGRRPRN